MAASKPKPKCDHAVTKGVKLSFLDWAAWANKLKWSFISFKFLAFFGFCGLLVAFWFGLQRAFQKSVEVATGLYSADYIEKEHVKDIVIQAQNVLYNEAVGHVTILAAAVMVSIVGLKMMAERVESKLSEKSDKLSKYIEKKKK